MPASGATYLIAGGTGQVGGEAARALLARGETVWLLVRDPARVTGLDGAHLVQGTFEDEAALARATAGVDVMLLAGRDNPSQVAQHERVLRAAEESGVGHVVKLSAIGASPTSPIELMRHHGVIEERLRSGPLRWTIVRPHLFLQNLLRAADVVRATGRLKAPMGAARVPLVDTRDIGEALAAILSTAPRRAGDTYALTGPAAVGYDDVAAAISRVAGRPVVYEPVEPDELERDLLAAGVPAWRALDLAHIATAYGDDDWAVTPDLERLLGRPPRSLEEFLEHHAHVFASAAAV
jgi:uncharacterized protein YbjT (DUF2867 family)